MSIPSEQVAIQLRFLIAIFLFRARRINGHMKTEINLFATDDGRFCLTIMEADDDTYELFDEMELQGGGYTWEGIVNSLVSTKMSAHASKLEVGAEADNMYVYCASKELLEELKQLVQSAIADKSLLREAIEEAGDDIE